MTQWSVIIDHDVMLHVISGNRKSPPSSPVLTVKYTRFADTSVELSALQFYPTIEQIGSLFLQATKLSYQMLSQEKPTRP